jgi:hypothetical protein
MSANVPTNISKNKFVRINTIFAANAWYRNTTLKRYRLVVLTARTEYPKSRWEDRKRTMIVVARKSLRIETGTNDTGMWKAWNENEN